MMKSVAGYELYPMAPTKYRDKLWEVVTVRSGGPVHVHVLRNFHNLPPETHVCSMLFLSVYLEVCSIGAY